MSYNRHAVALDIQDACNMRAIAGELVKVCNDAALHNSYPLEDDAAIILLVNKLESLCRSNDRFGPAYAICCEKASNRII